MLNINKTESKNIVYVSGILKEINVEEKIDKNGKSFVTGSALIGVDQEIDGKLSENEIPVSMFAYRKKKDGTDNKVYDGILKMREDYTSLAAAEDPKLASTVTITSGKIAENNFISKKSGLPISGFQISSNFMSKARSSDEQKATFELSGVVGDIVEELDKDENPTGRYKIKFIVIGYGGKANVVEIIVNKPNAINHVTTNFKKGDTVNIGGIISMTYKVTTVLEEQGFGEPIKRVKTESRRELILTSCSAAGLEEELSYDSDEVKASLAERTERINKMVEDAKTTSAPKSKSSSDLGF